MKKTLLAALLLAICSTSFADKRVIPNQIYCPNSDINQCVSVDGDMSGFDKTPQTDIIQGTYTLSTFEAPLNAALETKAQYVLGGKAFLMTSSKKWRAVPIAGQNWTKVSEMMAVCRLPGDAVKCPLSSI